MIPKTAQELWEAARRVNDEAADVDRQIQRLQLRLRRLRGEANSLEARARAAAPIQK